MSDAPPWFTKPWVNLVGERRSTVAAVAYTIVGLAFVLLAVVGDGSPVMRVMELSSGAIFVGFAISIAATLRWRRVHRTVGP